MDFLLGAGVTLVAFLIGFLFAWKLCPYLPNMNRVFSIPAVGSLSQEVHIPQLDYEDEEIPDEADIDIDEVLQNWKSAEEEEEEYQMLRRFKAKARRNNDGWLHY